MYQTSDKWKENIYKNPKSKYNVYIDNVLVDPNYRSDLKKGSILFNNDLELGSTPAQYIEAKFYKLGVPSNPKQIRVEYGILIGDSYEMIPIGLYNVDDYKNNDDNTVTIKALDNMIKFEFNYDGSKLAYPATLLEVLQDICLKAGVELRLYFFFEL